MRPALDKAELLGTPIFGQQHRILNGHAPVQDAIHEQQAAALLLHNPRLHQREGLLTPLHQLLPRAVAVLAQVRALEVKGVLVVVDLAQPLGPDVVVRAGAVADRAREPRGVRVREADGVVPARRQAPGDDLARVELGHGADVVEDRGEEPVRGQRVRPARGAVRNAGDVADHGRPAALEVGVCPLRVVRPVPVQPCYEQHHRARVGLGRCGRRADVQWDFLAISLVGILEREYHFLYGHVPERCPLHVRLLLRLVCLDFEGCGV
jgi:hypothetical protein